MIGRRYRGQLGSIDLMRGLPHGAYVIHHRLIFNSYSKLCTNRRAATSLRSALQCVSRHEANHWYGQLCLMAMAGEVPGTGWAMLVLRVTYAASTRFNELRRGIPLMLLTLLSKRLIWRVSLLGV
jgi:hypothetical protein